MKKFGSVFIFVFAIFFCSCFFSACDETAFTAKFTQTEISLEMEKEYDPYQYISETIDQATKDLITFKSANSTVAYVTPEQKIVATGYGATTLYVFYNNQQVASVIIKVPTSPIQLNTPVNIHYDDEVGAVVWNYTYYEQKGNLQLLKNYTLQITKDGQSLPEVEIQDKNYFELKNLDQTYGVYSVKVKANAPTEDYISSAYSEEYTFYLMAKPLNLQYDDTTKILTWDTNTNPTDTKYLVTYTLNGQGEKTVETSTNQLLIDDIVSAGEHTFKVSTVPQSDVYFKSESEVLKIEKLATPTLTFDNGVVTWNGNPHAKSYFVQIWKYDTEQDKWIDTEYSESISETGLATVTSSLPKNMCIEAGEYKVSVVVDGNENDLIFDSFESNQYVFSKLSSPQVEFVNDCEEPYFIIRDVYAQNGTITLKQNSQSALIWESSLTKKFDVQDDGEYSISAQIKTPDKTTKIDSEITTTFFVYSGDDKIDNLKTIRKLSQVSLTYFENQGSSYIEYTPNVLLCDYDLLIDNVLSSKEANQNRYNLGLTSSLFENNITQHTYRLNITKQPVNNTFYVDNFCEINVQQLTAPTLLKLSDNQVSVATQLASEVASVEYKISADDGDYVETQNLYSASKWNIKVRFLAQDTVTGGSTYFSASPVSTFKIQRLESPQNLNFNYLTNTLHFDAVKNAVSYNVYQNGILIDSVETNQVELQNIVGTVTLEAVPSSWQSIDVDTTGYLTSEKSSCAIYKVLDIENLSLTKDDNDVVTATWSEPLQNFADGSTKAVDYSVYVTSETTYFEVHNVTSTQYQFVEDLFDDVGKYTIKVQVNSPNNDFYPTATTKSVTITRLPSPEALTRNISVLSVKEYDSATMDGLRVQISGNDNPEIKNVNSFEFSVADTEKITIKVSVIGRFENNNYNLTSSYSEFYIQRLGTVENLKFDGFGSSAIFFNFSWTSYEQEHFQTKPAGIINYKIDLEEINVKIKASDTIDVESIEYKINTTNELLLHVQEISTLDKQQESTINRNEVFYLSSEQEKTVQVYRENTVENMELKITDTEIIASWDYTPRFAISGLYVPKFEVTLINANNESIADAMQNVASYNKNVQTSKYERVYDISNFETVGDYKIEVYVNGSKTIDSAIEYITITKLNKISCLSINANTATCLYDNPDNYNKDEEKNKCYMSFPENSYLVFNNEILTNDYNMLALDKINFTNITDSDVDVEFTVYHKGPTSAIEQEGHKQYYLDSESSTFCITRLPTVTVGYDEDKLFWDDVINDYIKDCASYMFYLTGNGLGEYLRTLLSNSLDMADTTLTDDTVGAGNNYVQVKTVVGERKIGVYDDTSATIGYLSSYYGDAVTVEKLKAPESLNLVVKNTDNTKLTLSWVDNNSPTAEKYYVYIYQQGSQRGEPITCEATYGTSIDLDRNLFETGTNIIEISAVAKQKITSTLSEKIVCSKLDPVISMTVDGDSVLSWANTNQIKQNTNIANSYQSYFIEVLSDGIVKFSHEITKEDISANGYNYKLLSYTGTNDDFLPSLEGEFAVRITIIGSGSTTKGIITLTSDAYTIDVKKLKSPTITVQDNHIIVSSNEDDVQYYVTVNNNNYNTYASIYQEAIELTDNAQDFEVTAYATSSSLNVVNSNISSLNVQKLTAPTNVSVVVSDADLEQSNVTLSWQSVAEATGYNIFVNDKDPIYTTNSDSYTFTNAFADVGTYTIKVQAVIGDTKLYSDLSNAVTIIRLKPMENAFIDTDGIVHFANTNQANNNYSLYTYLVDTELKSSTDMANTTETYEDYVTYLNNLAGGMFTIKIQYIGSGTTDENNICTLSSFESEINGYKLYAPQINIEPSYANINVSESNVEGLVDHVQNMVSVIFNDSSYAQNENGTEIKNLAINEILYPNIWEAGVYTFKAQTIPNEVKNVLPSNVSTVTTTRLDAPSGLSFSRESVGSEIYCSDTGVPAEKISDALLFNFTGVAHAKEYVLYNGSEYYVNSISQSEKILQDLSVDYSQAINLLKTNNFEKFLYSGNNQITITSVANIGGVYINSKSVTLTFDTLQSISASDFYTDGKNIKWSTTETQMQGFIIQGIQNTQIKYWQTTDRNTFESELLDFQFDGEISLNIKLIGNVTSTPKCDNIILDSMYICNENFIIANQTFTKLSTISTLATNKGYFVFDKVTNATTYCAYLDDGEGNKYDFILQDYQELTGWEEDSQFIGFNSQISKLDTSKTYSIYVIAQNTDNRTLYSNPSNVITAQILEDKNAATQLQLTNTESNDLTKKVIYVNVDSNASGVWVYENEKYTPFLDYDKTENKFTCYPNVFTGGLKRFEFASLGSTLNKDASMHYLTSSYAILTLDALDEVTITVEDGKFKWENVDSASGYYVYVNDNLYGGTMYTQTELSLDEISCDTTNGVVKLKIVPVYVPETKLWGPDSYYELVQLIGSNKQDNQTFVKKLHKPDNINVEDGMLLWSQGITGLDNYLKIELENYLSAISANPTIENVNMLDEYLENIFTMPITLYSQYSGFNDLEITLSLTANGQTHILTTDAYKFLTMTQTQKNNFDDLCTTLRNGINDILVQLNVTPTEHLYTLETQRFTDEIEFVSARLMLIEQHFDADDENLIRLVDCVNQTGSWPTLNNLFEEFEGNKTASLQAGLYVLAIAQHGNDFDWLNSVYSDNQNIYVAPAPQNLEIVSSNEGSDANDFYLYFSKVNLDSACYYPTDIKYILVGENDSGNRVVLSQEYSEINGKIQFNLTSLVESGILSIDITKLFVYVKGNDEATDSYCKSNNKYQVITGVKSRAIEINVLPQLKPWFSNGELVLAEEFNGAGFEIKSIDSNNNSTSTIINTTNWIGDTLSSGATYTIIVRSVGASGKYTDNVTISGKYFTFTAQKLKTPTVNINKYGQFTWTAVANSKGYILYIDNNQQDDECFVSDAYMVKQEEGQTLYQSNIEGYKNYKFRMLGTTSGNVLENQSGYYFNSMINNSQGNTSGTGYDAVMLSAIDNIFVENGYLKWTPINTTLGQNVPLLTDGQTIEDHYKVIIDDDLVFYTSELDTSIYYPDVSNNRCLDLTNTNVDNGKHTIVIQPYLYVVENDTWQNSKTQVKQSDYVKKEYYQLLGVQTEVVEVNKIEQPYNIKVENGEIVWTGNSDDIRYNYQIYDDNLTLVDSGTVSEAKIWPADIVKPDGTLYTFKVKAYQEGSLCSNYSTMMDNFGNPITFEKLQFDLPNISYVTEDSGNYIVFKIDKSGKEYGINIKYSVNDANNFKILKCYDANYSDVVSKYDSNSEITFKIKVDEIADNIEHLYYYLQLVCLGTSTNYVASNFNESVLEYSIPTALQTVYFDDETFEYFFEAQEVKTGYIIRDEILDINDELVATLFYKIDDQEFSQIKKQNYFKERMVNDETINTISFSPVVMGYKHKVSVATTSTSTEENIALMSAYTTCEYIYDSKLFVAENDIFGEESEIYSILTKLDFTNYITDNMYGTENNAYLIENAEDFEKLNLRLNKYSYLSSFTITVTNTTYGEISISTNNSQFYFKQTTDIENIDFVIGIRENMQTSITQYTGFNNIYDGQDHKIQYSLTPTEESDKFGLFRIIEEDGVIKNLVVDATINYNNVQLLGGLTAENKGTLENITISQLIVNNFEIKSSNVKVFKFGVVAGINNGTMSNIITSSNVNELNVLVDGNDISVYIGGLVAQNNTSALIQQSGNKIKMSIEGTAKVYLGGVVAYNNGSVLQCYNATQISAISSVVSSKVYVGGIVGYNESGEINCVYSLGKVSSTIISTGYDVYAGGIVGWTNNKNIKNSYSAVDEIILKNEGTIVYGGTFIGKVNTTSSTEYENFYVNSHPFGNDTTPYGVFASVVDITKEQAIDNLVEKLNQLTNDEVYTIINGNIAFVWEMEE